jgi:hypothetical protein
MSNEEIVLGSLPKGITLATEGMHKKVWNVLGHTYSMKAAGESSSTSCTTSRTRPRSCAVRSARRRLPTAWVSRGRLSDPETAFATGALVDMQGGDQAERARRSWTVPS